MRQIHRTVGRRRLAAGLSLATTMMLAAAAPAQTPTFTPLVTGDRVVTSLAHDGLVYAGLRSGGLVVWDPATATTLRSLDRSDGLGGHFVADLAWSGSRLWIATEDGGLTAITDPGGPDESLRVYSSALSSLDITAVTGTMVGQSERVFYGTDGDGIGAIQGGLPGAYLTTLDGLIDDVVIDLALSADLLLIATPDGISRFAENTFTSYPYADPDTEFINDLEVGPDGDIWAATDQGVKRWDDTARQWVRVTFNAFVNDLAVGDDTIWALSGIGSLRTIRDGVVTVREVPPAQPGRTFVVNTVAAEGDVAWLGGYDRPSDGPSNGSLVAWPWLAVADDAGATVHTLATCLVGATAGMDGVAIDARGRAWLGDQAGDGISGWDGEQWDNVLQRATAENDSSGLFDWSGNILAMARGNDDDIWFAQFTNGAIRYTPPAAPGGQEEWLLLSPENSPMLGDAFLHLAVHPDGPVFFCTDNVTFGGSPNNDYGVDVLADPGRPRDPASWLHLAPGLLGGNVIRAITFTSRDVVWIAVAGAGLMRWDVNGLGAGADAPLTWTDTSDDHWAGPVASVDGTDIDLASTQSLLPGPDGSLLAGGAGLVQLRYEPILDLATLENAWKVKDSAFTDGLLGQSVLGLARDRNGHYWSLTSGGLNRLRFREDGVTIDAFTDLGTFFTLDSGFYAPSAIVALPGGTYRDLAASAAGDRLVLSSDLGAALVTIPEQGASLVEAAGAAYLYPNPFPGETTADRVSIGGLPIDADEPASIQVLNLVGQIVFRTRRLESGEGFWDGRNRQGERVASGLYVVRIEQGGQTLVRTLAVAY